MARRWITAEDKQLGVLYQQGVSLRAIAAALNRTEEGVGARRRALGLPARPRSRPWSAREEQLLSAAHRQGLPASALASTLCRTPEQIRRRRRALFGTSRAGRPYTSIEDAAIRLTFHPAADIAQIAADLGRSPGSVQHRARKLGLYHPPRRTRWQEHEDATLRDGYTRGLTCQQIAAQLPHRSPGAAAARAAKLGLATYARRWSATDDEALARLTRAGRSLEQAAQILARTPAAVRARARKLGITPPAPDRHARGAHNWSAVEDERLALHAELNPAVLAQLLDRSPDAISQRLRRLALRDGRHCSPHHPPPPGGDLSPGERAVIARELATPAPRRLLALARRLQRPPSEIQTARSR